MGQQQRIKKRLFQINLLIAAAGLFILAGLLSLAFKPEATIYIGWLFSGSCFMVAFLMIRHKILKRFGK